MHKSYWHPTPPKAYDAKLSDQDIQEMQTIDADCNDCKYFQRGQLIKEIDGLTGKIPLGKSGQYFLGHCRKFDKATTAFPVHFTGHSCFEHRKS